MSKRMGVQVWQQRLSEQSKSGQSLRAWCVAHKISYSSALYWKKKMVDQDKSALPIRFVEVHTTDRPVASVHLHCSGFVLEVTERTPEKLLRKICKVVKELC